MKNNIVTVILMILASVLIGQVFAQDYVYVANSYVHGPNPFWSIVAKLDAETLEILDEVQVYDNAHSLALTHDRSRLWVTCPSSQYIVLIDTVTFEKVRVIDLGDIELEDPVGVEITPDGTKAYVTYSGTGEIGIWTADTGNYIDRVTVGGSPQFILFSPDGAKAYLVDYQNCTVKVLRTSDNTVEATLSFSGYALQDAVISPDGSMLYVANMSENQIEVIRTSDNSILEPIVTGDIKPRSLGISPDGNYLFAGYYLAVDALVKMIRLSDRVVVDTAPIPSNPRRIAVNNDGSRIYVTEHNDDECYAYDVSGETLTQAASQDLNTIPDNYASPVGIVISEDSSSCSTMGCEIIMPMSSFGPGDDFYTDLQLCNTGATTAEGMIVAVILEVYGIYLFAPGFNEEFDYYTWDIPPGASTRTILPLFAWPSGAGSGEATWYAAMITADLTGLIGEMDMEGFSWHP
ncbi:YncE family protein [bacterium]|nr:YncE family protein [bacterium]